MAIELSRSPGGHDDDLGPGGRDPDLDAGVAILGQLAGQELVELGFENAVSDELENIVSKILRIYFDECKRLHRTAGELGFLTDFRACGEKSRLAFVGA
jgi:hypothetical protein